MSDDFFRRMADEAEAIARVARAAIARRPTPDKLVSRGNVLALADSVEAGLCWVVTAVEGSRATLVPADSFPIAEADAGDVSTELEEPIGSLVLRTSCALTVAVDELRGARFVGTMPAVYVEAARKRAARPGVAPAGVADPELEAWMGRVRRAATTLRGRQAGRADPPAAVATDPGGWVRAGITAPAGDGPTLDWPELEIRLPGATLTLARGVTRLPTGDTRFLVRARDGADVALERLDLAIEDRNGNGTPGAFVGEGALFSGIQVRFPRLNVRGVAALRARVRPSDAASTPEGLEALVAVLADIVRSRGKSATEARKDLVSAGIPEDKARAAQAEFERQTGRIRSVREPLTVYETGLPTWYAGPGPDDLYWPALRGLLAKKPGWDEGKIASLDTSSTKVLSLLPPPAQAEFRSRGLVIGYVQSGKTANYSALIAKAADARYKFFIVLAGMHNNLRAQTHGRLFRELAALNPKHWMVLTTEEDDFRASNQNATATLGPIGNQKVFCVVKKNKAVLQRLQTWLLSADPLVLRECPVIVIDDEADQASISPALAARRTTINNLIIEILRSLPKAAYVGYTATPFANVLIDPTVPEDLYPRDFIVDLPRPPDYFGGERIFGRDALNLDAPDASFDGLDMIRTVPTEETGRLTPVGRAAQRTFEPSRTASVEQALRYFWMATAARYARGQQNEHSSMLVHTTLYTEVQERLAPRVDEYRQEIRGRLDRKEPALLAELRKQWATEMATVPAVDLGERSTIFDELEPYLMEVVERSTTLVENSRQDLRLRYSTDKADIIVVIGGNTLSRGLTLEGLVVSLFVRNANAYDTLLQMGRWFGYRPGYSDLPRIWMTDELRGYFYDLATVEQEIRNDVRRYDAEALTPLDFGVRIRTHPALAVTSRLKMQAAVDCEMSLSDRRIQTILFDHKSKPWLEKNWAAGAALLRALVADGITRERSGPYDRFVDVPAAYVQEFFRNYRMHGEGEIQSSTVREYVERQNNVDELLRWTVAIVGSTAPKAGSGSFGPGLDVRMLNRSRLKNTGKPYANVKAIMSPPDSWADGALRVPDNAMTRTLEPDENPMLLLYPIDRVSPPERSTKREPLDAASDVLGVGMLFPIAGTPTPVRYVTVDLSSVPREDIDSVLEEEADVP